MTTEEYRAHPALNFSSAKHLLKSPADFKAAQAEKREPTKAMELGTLIHAIALEGKNLTSMVNIRPEGVNLATKEGKAWKESVDPSKPIITGDDVEMIRGMNKSILENPHAQALLNGCQMLEMPLLASLKGIECKGLIDAAGTDGKDWVIADLKTTQDASPREFASTVAKHHYDLQAAWYSALLGQVHQIEEQPDFFWIVVEKTPPFTCIVYSATNWITGGNDKLERVLDTYRECEAAKSWPQPHRGIINLEKPAWA